MCALTQSENNNLTVECPIVPVRYKQKGTFFTPEFDQINQSQRLPNLDAFSDSKIQK